MLSLKGRQDGFRLLLPKEFIVKEVEEKYSKILNEKLGYFISPIDFVNESIQKVSVLGFQNGTVQQNQTSYGAEPTMNPKNRPKTLWEFNEEQTKSEQVLRVLNVFMENDECWERLGDIKSQAIYRRIK